MLSLLLCATGTAILSGIATVTVLELTMCREIRGLLKRARNFEARYLQEDDPLIMDRYARYSLLNRR